MDPSLALTGSVSDPRAWGLSLSWFLFLGEPETGALGWLCAPGPAGSARRPGPPGAAVASGSLSEKGVPRRQGPLGVCKRLDVVLVEICRWAELITQAGLLVGSFRR